MGENILNLILPSFLAGFISFFLPCTLPLLPFFISFVSGVAPQDLAKPEMRKQIMVSSLLFVIGFSLVVVVLGMVAGSLAASLRLTSSILSQVAGVGLIILGGGMMLNILPYWSVRWQLPGQWQLARPVTAFLLGVGFAGGWTPCIGPLLASVLLLASVSATAASGGLLLAVFAAGMSLPFLLVAAGLGGFMSWLPKVPRLKQAFHWGASFFLIGLGLLLLFGQNYFLIQGSAYLYRIFSVDFFLTYL